MRKTLILALTVGALTVMGTTVFAAQTGTEVAKQQMVITAPVSTGDYEVPEVNREEALPTENRTNSEDDDCEVYNECGEGKSCSLSGKSCCK